jgi:ligand-binding SRPBCC domain-containing protein
MPAAAPRAQARSVFQVELPASCDEAWDWHARAGAFERLVPPFDPVRLVSSSGTIHEGDSKVLALPPLGLRWVARHGRAVRGELFVDSQERGPFASFVHHHRFAPSSSGSCLLSDELDWRLPLEPASRWIVGTLVRSKLARMFAWRHHVVVHDLAMARTLSIPPLRLELTGSGPLRAGVAALLDTQGHQLDTPVAGLAPPRPVDARLRLEEGALVVEPRSGRAAQLRCGTLVLRARDLARGRRWTLLEELVSAALLCAAGRIGGGSHAVAREERPDEELDAPLRPLALDGVELPLRWRSLADLTRRLLGRVRAVPARRAPGD